MRKILKKKILFNKKGMTLVELVCAMLLLMLVLSGFMVFFVRGVLWAGRGMDQTQQYTANKRISDNILGGETFDPAALDPHLDDFLKSGATDGHVTTGIEVDVKVTFGNELGNPIGEEEDLPATLYAVILDGFETADVATAAGGEVYMTDVYETDELIFHVFRPR